MKGWELWPKKVSVPCEQELYETWGREGTLKDKNIEKLGSSVEAWLMKFQKGTGLEAIGVLFWLYPAHSLRT